MKIKIWVTGRMLDKNREYNTTKSTWVKTCNYINKELPAWEMIIVYQKEGNKELKRYYNYDNKKTFPQSIWEI